MDLATDAKQAAAQPVTGGGPEASQGPLRIAIWFQLPPRASMVGEGIALHTSMLLRAWANDPTVEVEMICPAWARSVVDDYFRRFRLHAGNIKVTYVHSFYRVPELIWNHLAAQAMRKENIRIDRTNWRRVIAESPVVVHGTHMLSPLLLPLVPAMVPVAYLMRFLGRSQGMFAAALSRLVLRGVEANLTYNMAGRISRSRADVCFVPYVGWSRSHRVRQPILTGIHDIVFAEFPSRFEPEEISAIALECRRMAWRADAAFAISPRVRERHVIQFLGFEPDRVFLLEHAPLPLDEFLPKTPDRGREKLKSYLHVDIHRRRVQRVVMANPYWRGWLNVDSVFDDPFIYFPSQYRPYKNIERLLYAINMINSSGRLKRPLRLLTTADLTVVPKIVKQINRLKMYETVIPLLRLPVELHAAAYANAALGILPSEFEGGTPSPVSEAISVGTPVVLSNQLYLEHFRSVSRLGKVTFDPLSITEMADRILFAIEQREECLDIGREMLNCINHRTWKDTAADLVRQFRFAIANPRVKDRDWKVKKRNIAEY